MPGRKAPVDAAPVFRATITRASDPHVVRERVFAARHQARWERLDALVGRCDARGLATLTAPELEELAFLYRSVTTDLAAAKTRGYSSDLVTFLNRSTARAYAIVHVGTARGGWSNVATFFTTTLPREVRASWKIIAVTTLLFLVAVAVSYWLVATRANNAYAVLPDAEIPTITKSLHDSNFGFDRAFSAEESSRIITNNIKVSMLAFAGGIATLGIVTIWAIFTNGLMVGGLAGLYAHTNFELDFWATVAPHGVIELTSIQIAGAAGLQFTQAIIAPGRLRRIDALRRAGRHAGTLMIGVAGLLVIAGTIEGFISPQRWSIPVRLSIGAFTAVSLFSYFALAGRERPAVLRRRAQSKARALTSR